MRPISSVATFSALADPTRRAILARLTRGRGDGGGAGRAVRHDVRRRVEAPPGARGSGARHPGARRPVPARPSSTHDRWPRHPTGSADYARFWEDSLGALDHYLNALQQLGAPTATANDKENTHG